MKFHVNADCIGCGLCVSTCPEVFTMTDGGTAAAAPADVTGPDEAAAPGLHGLGGGGGLGAGLIGRGSGCGAGVREG